MSSTRLLMLGAVRIFQPVHGYFVRRELLTWRVEQWANINPGSIYNALRTLERDGFIRAVHTEGKPARTTYELTDDGETEFLSLLREALWHVVPNDPARIYTAISFLWALSRQEVIEALESRLAQLDSLHRGMPYMLGTLIGHADKPRHIAEFAYLQDEFVLGERAWTEACLQRIRDGAYVFDGEPEHPWTLTERDSQA
jgi:DNA-binding PadR family transcriptional regulator